MFKIEITETKAVKKIVGKDWKVIGTREVPRDGAYIKGSDDPKTRIEDVHGYTPEVEKTVEETHMVLTQCVCVMDLPAVIKAINNLE